MSHAKCDIMWFQTFLEDLCSSYADHDYSCDNHATISIINIFVFHERTKYIKVLTTGPYHLAWSVHTDSRSMGTYTYSVDILISIHSILV